MNFNSGSNAFKNAAITAGVLIVLTMSLIPYAGQIASNTIQFILDFDGRYVLPIALGMASAGFVLYLGAIVMGLDNSGTATKVFIVFFSCLAGATAVGMWYPVSQGLPISPSDASIPIETMYGVFSGAAFLAGIHWSATNKSNSVGLRMMFTIGFVSAVLVMAAVIADVAAVMIAS